MSIEAKQPQSSPAAAAERESTPAGTTAAAPGVSATEGPPGQPASRPTSVWGKMEHLMAEYGPIALGTYLTIFGLTWAGFAAAISMGVAVESAAGGAGLVGASWLATKVTQPLRIGATAVLTPVVARFTRRAPGRTS